MTGENQLLLNTLVSILPSLLPSPSRVRQVQIARCVVPYSKSFEPGCLAVRTLFPPSEISLLA